MNSAAIAQLSTRAYGWLLERRDGITIGFTSHDRDVEIGGVTYHASPGMEPTSIIQTEGLEAGGLDVKGALSSRAIREDDLRAGRWNRAKVQIFLFDWEQPSGNRHILASGELGNISYSGDAFDAELLGVADRLGQPVVPATSPSCRAVFCDADCALSVRRYQHYGTATGSDGKEIALQGLGQWDPASFKYGKLRFLSGANTGLTYNIANGFTSSATYYVQVTENIAFPFDSPARVVMTEGCDKTLSTCSGRFGNAINFRGEAFLPGNDLLTRYPGAK